MFGFADDLRTSSVAACSALLVLSHWEVIPEDPFFVPKTEEEKEEFGDGSGVLQNTARKLIDSVKRRNHVRVDLLRKSLIMRQNRELSLIRFKLFFYLVSNSKVLLMRYTLYDEKLIV